MPDHDATSPPPQRPPFSARLRVRIDAFLAKSGMSPTTFGQLILNDTSLYTRIKRGRPISTDTVDRIEDLMRASKTEVSARIEANKQQLAEQAAGRRQLAAKITAKINKQAMSKAGAKS